MGQAENVQTAADLIQFVGTQIAKRVGGIPGQAAASWLLGQPGHATSLVDLVEKIESDTAQANDYADVLQHLASVLAGFGVLVGAASPHFLVVVGVAGGLNFLTKRYPLSDFTSGIADVLVEDAIRSGLQTPRPPQIDISALDPKTLLPRPGAADVNAPWRSARTFNGRRDPLAIDLDGDGLETLGIPASGSPVLFDHDCDGVKTGTGWLRPDDAWLVRDLDGSGRIDSGLELFGVDTDITVTEVPDGAVGPAQTFVRKALSGFEALRALDGNADHVFVDAADAAWTEVQLWRDLNGDGVSQAGELASPAALNITGIALDETAAGTNLGNGNSITATVQRSVGGNVSVAAMVLRADFPRFDRNVRFQEFR